MLGSTASVFSRGSSQNNRFAPGQLSGVCDTHARGTILERVPRVAREEKRYSLKFTSAFARRSAAPLAREAKSASSTAFSPIAACRSRG